MATPFDTAPSRARGGDAFSTVIAEYLREAEAGRALDAAGGSYSPAELRSLRRSFAHVGAVLGDVQLSAVADADRAALEELGWQVIDQTALPPSRIGPIVDALNTLFAYYTWQRPVEPPRWQRPARRRPVEPPPQPAGDSESRTPTDTMLVLGAQVGAWMERIIVIAFLLTAIGLALALA
jgi:hypothetical protein